MVEGTDYASNKPALSRLKRMEKEGREPDMPPFDGPAYLLAYFWEIGPCMSGAMGHSKLTHTEIQDWQKNTGIQLNAWECRTLVRLSLDYLSEAQRATGRNAAPPWVSDDAVSEEQKKQVAIDMMAAMRKLAED